MIISKRRYPQNMMPEDKPLFDRSSEYIAENPVIHWLRHVFVMEGGQVFKIFKINPDSLNTPIFLNKYRPAYLFRCVLSAVLRRRLIRIKYPCAVVHDEWSFNYFHWMTDVVSRLYLIRNSLDRLTIILPESYNTEYHTYCLHMLGVKNVLYMRPKDILFGNQILLTGHTAPAGNYHPGILKYSLQMIAPKKWQLAKPSEKIYVSRSKAASRKVVNEEAVRVCLTAIGFRIICLEDYSLHDQIDLMRHTKILISIHGAGLTNLMFMQEGTAVLELRKKDPSEIYNCYCSLASELNILYYYLFGETVDNFSPQQANIRVDLTMLRETYNQMEKRLK